MLIAVAPNRHAYGVECSADDWREPQGSERNCRAIVREDKLKQVGIVPCYQVTDLSRALDDTHATDAHFVCYVLRERGAPAAMQPRVNKPGLPAVVAFGWQVTIDVLAADIDNPEHCDWTPELLELAHEQDAHLLAMGCGVYYTEHGRRAIAPLSHPIVVGEEDVEGVLAAWLGMLEREAGVHPDPACRDWTRHFRLPHVRRAGRPYRSPIVLLDAMRPIDPPAPIRAAPWVRRRGAVLGAVGPVEGSPLARAFEAAGWLGRSLGAGKVSALCPWRAQHTLGRDLDSSTILFGPSSTAPLGWFHCSHGHCRDRRQSEVIAELPPLAQALIPAAAAPTPGDRVFVPKDEARRQLEDAFRHAPDGLSLVVSGCGAGKSQAAIVIAGERAATPYASADAKGLRAPAHSKTSISVPTTRLAAEHAARLRANGVSVRRLFGPLSVRREDGSPECRYHESAQLLARAAISVPWELCEGRGKEPCDYADQCLARGGEDGSHDARVTIGPHAMIAQLSAGAGSTGLLVVDEPPDLLEHVVLQVEDLRAAQTDLGRYFEWRYVAALRVSLRAVEDWIQHGPLDVPGPLDRALGQVDETLLDEAFAATGEADPVLAARKAFEPGHHGTIPPIRREAVAMARRSPGIARAIGVAGRVARLVHLGFTSDPGHVVARLEERRKERMLVLTAPNIDLREALRRDGPAVVADANGRLQLPIYERVVGYAPPVTEVHAADGCDVQRTLLRVRATRSGWAPGGKLDVSPALVRVVRAMVDWVLEDAGTVRIGLVTFELLELAIRAALGEDMRDAWRARRQPTDALERARDLLAPELARLKKPPDLGHYGAIRGLDHWKDHDCVITVGDPWPQLTDARWEAELLRLPSPEARYEARCAAELEQAHGRLRTVHRTRAARALHVGTVMPSGWPADVDQREVSHGRPRTGPGMPVDELRGIVEGLGGFGDAMKALGVQRGTLGRYLAGDRAVPPDIASRWRQTLAEAGGVGAGGSSHRKVLESNRSPGPFGDCATRQNRVIALKDLSVTGNTICLNGATEPTLKDLSVTVFAKGPFGDSEPSKVASKASRGVARAPRQGRPTRPRQGAGGRS
jgi:hypothetical protein